MSNEITEALIRSVYKSHGHPDDWGVQVIYEDTLVKHLVPLLTALYGERE